VSTLLAAAGVTVHVADVDLEAAASVADRIGGVAVRLDVRDTASWDVVAAAAPYDLALLNAGIGGPRTVLGADAAEFDRVLDINLRGVVQGTRALATAMAGRGGGRITALASMAGLWPMPMAPVYGASKWGVVGWVQSAAPELSAAGVVLTGVCPAWTDTAIVDVEARALLGSMDVALMPVGRVADLVLRALTTGGPGELFAVEPHEGETRVHTHSRFDPLP